MGFFSYTRSAPWGLVYMLRSGREIKVILTDLETAAAGSWNPDFTRLVFESEYDIWVVNRDGTGLQKIVDATRIAHDPEWSPTGDWIAYNDDSRDGVGPPDELYLVRPDGTGSFPVGGTTVKREFTALHPSWDPSGTRIAAGSDWEVAPGDFEPRIVIFSELFGTPQRALATTDTQLQDAFGSSNLCVGCNGVAWSPDSVWIAFNVVAADVQWIARVRADGSGDIELLTNGLHPSWSPDGQTIFFNRSIDGVSHIFSTPASGGTETDLSAITDPDANDSMPFLR